MLLDTQIVLAIVNKTTNTLPANYQALLLDKANDSSCSVASIWEIAIKVRLGKLQIATELNDLAPVCLAFNMNLLDIKPHHVVAQAVPEPPTRDPFDRLLLAQAHCEGMQLVTLDRMLLGHPLAWTSPA